MINLNDIWKNKQTIVANSDTFLITPSILKVMETAYSKDLFQQSVGITSIFNFMLEIHDGTVFYIFTPYKYIYNNICKLFTLFFNIPRKFVYVNADIVPTANIFTHNYSLNMNGKEHSNKFLLVLFNIYNRKLFSSRYHEVLSECTHRKINVINVGSQFGEILSSSILYDLIEKYVDKRELLSEYINPPVDLSSKSVSLMTEPIQNTSPGPTGSPFFGLNTI